MIVCEVLGHADGSKGADGLQAGGFHKEAPRRRPQTLIGMDAEWLGVWCWWFRLRWFLEVQLNLGVLEVITQLWYIVG